MRLTPDKMEIVEGSVKRVALDLTALVGSATINSATFAAEPSDLTIASTTISGKTVTCLVSGGDGGRNYILKLTVVLSDGETEVGTILLKWKEPGDIHSGGL